MLWDLQIMLSEECANQTPDISMLFLLQLVYGILCQIVLKLKFYFTFKIHINSIIFLHSSKIVYSMYINEFNDSLLHNVTHKFIHFTLYCLVYMKINLFLWWWCVCFCVCAELLIYKSCHKLVSFFTMLYIHIFIFSFFVYILNNTYYFLYVQCVICYINNTSMYMYLFVYVWCVIMLYKLHFYVFFSICAMCYMLYK